MMIAPKPWTRPWQVRKRMTIAIGITAINGIVVAADTQETLGSQKTTESKLLIANHIGSGGIVTTGAGNSGYLEHINQEICRSFLQRKKWKTDSFFDVLQKKLLSFHHDDVVPYADFPDYERPAIELVIGAQIDKKMCLWTSEKGALSSARNYCAVGIGRSY